MKNRCLRIRTRVPLEYSIKFGEWVPSIDNPLHLDLNKEISCLKKSVSCNLYIANENIMKCNKHWINLKTREPLNFEEILQLDKIDVDEISIEVIVENIENDILIKLKNGEEDYDFALKINCLIIDTINSFLYFIRNELGQHFVELIPNHQKNWPLANFSKGGAEYKIDNKGSWHVFRPAHYNKLPIEQMPANLVKYSTINKDHISCLTSFICEGQNKSDMQKILVVDAKMHFANQNYRMALVEAVIALESTLKYFLKKSIGKRYGQHKISEDEIESFWKDVGLYKMILIGLRWWFSAEKIPDDILQIVAEAINTRNNIIHNMQRSISHERAKEYLGAIFTLCSSLMERVSADIDNIRNTDESNFT